MPAVDAHAPQEPTTDSREAVVPDNRQRLFARERTAEPETPPTASTEPKRAGKGGTEEKQD